MPRGKKKVHKFKPGTEIYVDDKGEPIPADKRVPDDAQLWTADENGILQPPPAPERKKRQYRRRVKTEVSFEMANGKMPSMPSPEPPPLVPSIEEHEGRKYLRKIRPAKKDCGAPISIMVDVYCVLEAFDVKCPAVTQAIKKLLCAGARGKGDRIADLVGAIAALNRAVEMEQDRASENVSQ